jgi:hypothetical protein
MNEKENMNMRKQGKVYDVTTEHVYHPAARKTMNKKVVNHVNGPTRLNLLMKISIRYHQSFFFVLFLFHN